MLPQTPTDRDDAVHSSFELGRLLLVQAPILPRRERLSTALPQGLVPDPLACRPGTEITRFFPRRSAYLSLGGNVSCQSTIAKPWKSRTSAGGCKILRRSDGRAGVRIRGRESRRLAAGRKPGPLSRHAANPHATTAADQCADRRARVADGRSLRHGGGGWHGRRGLRRAGQPAGDPRGLGPRRPGHQLGHEAPRSQHAGADRAGRRLRLHDAAGLRPRIRNQSEVRQQRHDLDLGLPGQLVRGARPDRRFASFLWRDGVFQRITTDHTIEQEFIAAGVAPEIAGKYSHMLTRCLRYDATKDRPDVYHVRLRPGDQLLSCTDGLTDMVSENVIAECVDARRPHKPPAYGWRLALTRAGRTTSPRCWHARERGDGKQFPLSIVQQLIVHLVRSEIMRRTSILGWVVGG